ncbi:DUF2887 domain-containing protein [Pelatocladus sp. BLCC-F211]|uniref:DUF2887 domain-containing protein n=1 Tax=Pelatocladus sp. BLCC-F211 TaxID=3342752 RepID=UPI0035B99630
MGLWGRSRIIPQSNRLLFTLYCNFYPTRSGERENPSHFGEILALNRVRRIYLDELGEAAEASLGVGVVKLVIEVEDTAPELARRLIQQTKQQVTDEAAKRDLINLIETIKVTRERENPYLYMSG